MVHVEELPQLPKDVYELVAQKLPAAYLPSLRLVSKKWQTVLFVSSANRACFQSLSLRTFTLP